MNEMTERDHSKNIQLKQRLIHVQSELTKYQRIVMKYKEDYHYSLIDALEEKNQELLEEAKLKSEEFDKLKTNYLESIEETNRLTQEIEVMNREHQKVVAELVTEKNKNSELAQKNKNLELELRSVSKRLEEAEQAKQLLEKKAVLTNTEEVLTEEKDENPASWFVNSLKNQKQ